MSSEYVQPHQSSIMMQPNDSFREVLVRCLSLERYISSSVLPKWPSFLPVRLHVSWCRFGHRFRGFGECIGHDLKIVAVSIIHFHMPICATVHPCTGVLRNPSYTVFFGYAIMFFYTCFSVFDKKKSSWPIQALLGKSAFHSKISVGLCAKCGFLPRNDDDRIWELAIRFTQRITFRSFRKLILGIPAGRTSDQLKGLKPGTLGTVETCGQKHQEAPNHWKPELKPEISYPHLLFQHCSPRCQGAHRVEHSLCSGTGLWVSTSAAPADPLRSVLEHLFEHFIRLCQAAPVTGEDNLCSSLLWPPQSPYDDAKWCKMMLLRSSPYPLQRPSLRPQPSQDSAKASCGVMAPRCSRWWTLTAESRESNFLKTSFRSQ